MQFPAPDLVSSRRLLLITDQLPAPADFLLHRFLHLHLKQSKIANCIVLAVSESLERWKSVASKANINVAQNESFQFIDIFDQHPHGEGNTNDLSLKSIYDLLSVKLSDSRINGQIPLVILDDITSLEWLGVSLLDLSRFSRALRTLCVKMDAALVVRHHIVTPPEPDALLQHLLQLCTYHIEVRPLASGRSGAVSGEICVHLGPGMKDTKEHFISRTSALQYRLTESSAMFFEKGTSTGVL
ncbi:hypothetical protein DEU56DRAFT_913302 [Suillus clintonianus]|uniref:uncharacterized protein n=1 Tax=Suillus clintonianus TaxID=1904413 RepID=UPI001B85D8A4|nr:uncharacterized protein DEU56DRAFT_913302 [Suillus clintonianus]KAG2135463.1 hypothetical protein DEU56DRAFT_913302 [Suillus clintonianus]